jgi:protein-S-isoprenylcysteine O-methyltransferase Ste14
VKTEDLVFIPLIIGEASGVFAGFCPSWFTVSSPFFHEQEAKEGNVKRIRWGEIAATAIVVATGAAISAQTKSSIPWWVSIATCAIFIGGYEYMIAHPAKSEDGAGVPANVTTALHWNRAR